MSRWWLAPAALAGLILAPVVVAIADNHMTRADGSWMTATATPTHTSCCPATK